MIIRVRRPLSRERLARASDYLWQRLRRKGPMPRSMAALILFRTWLRLLEQGYGGMTKEEWIIPAPSVPLNFTVVQGIVIRKPRMMFVGKTE